jgi:hypothetical protein
MSETTTTTTISDFLLARIAEDEAEARAAQPGGWYAQGGGQVMLPAPWSRRPWTENAVVVSPATTIGPQGQSDADHIARWDPARVLAECEAKRRLVELHAIQVERDRQSPFDPATGAERSEWAVDLYCDVCGWVSVACDTLHALASVYADHPDYQQEWRL